jgi:hypothetical protein
VNGPADRRRRERLGERVPRLPLGQFGRDPSIADLSQDSKPVVSPVL